MSSQIVSISKFLSLILRHKPEEIGLWLDPEGWAGLEELLRLSAAKGKILTRSLLEEVVATNDKQRFAFNANRSKIRASQGHSIVVQLGLNPLEPPVELFHGTATRFLEDIRREGILKGKRHHVHLSIDPASSTKVGQRHGQPVVLRIAAGEMHRAGHTFYSSANGVWLTDHVPPAFFEVAR